MTGYLATHLVTLTRTDVDGVTTTVAANLPASVLRQPTRGASSFRFNDVDTPVTIRLPHGTTAQQGDQITDTATSTRWLIDTASQNTNPALPAPVITQCRDLT